MDELWNINVKHEQIMI